MAVKKHKLYSMSHVCLPVGLLPSVHASSYLIVTTERCVDIALSERWLDAILQLEVCKLDSHFLSKCPWAKGWPAFSLSGLQFNGHNVNGHGGLTICSPVTCLQCTLESAVECTCLSFVYAWICEQRLLLDGNAKEQTPTKHKQIEELSI